MPQIRHPPRFSNSPSGRLLIAARIEPRSRLFANSDPAGVDHIMLRGAGRSVVGSKKDAEARNVLRLDPPFQALRFEPLFVALGREPSGQLPLCPHPAGSDRVDADIVWPIVARERPCQPD